MSPQKKAWNRSRWRRPNKHNTNGQTRRYKNKSSHRMKKIELRKKLEHQGYIEEIEEMTK